MAITVHKATGTTIIYREYEGESTDTKPTPSDLAVNSKFFEQDTGDFYYYDGSTWNKIGA